MKNIFLLLGLAFLLFYTSCSANDYTEIKVKNRLSIHLADVLISSEINYEEKVFTLLDGETEIPYQIINENGKRRIVFVINLNPDEEKILKLIPDYDKKEKQFKPRTYAELAMKPGNIYIDGKFRGDRFDNVTKIKVPEIHTDHDALFKYEGPGWESEKVGYRFYLDWRNATDIFGKKTNELILNQVGVHDTVAKDDSYHQMQEWGMDIFKVGRSLGIGSVAMWHNGKVNMVSTTDSIYCVINENGPIRSKVRTNYFGWQVGNKKYDLESDFSISAGSRLTKVELTIDNSADSLATGLAKFDGTNFIKSDSDNEWAYIALYGNQSLAGENDKLGIALFYKTSSLLKQTADELNHVVILKPLHGKLEYYFCAAWEQEPDGITNEEEFVTYLYNTKKLLSNPPIIKINK